MGHFHVVAGLQASKADATQLGQQSCDDDFSDRVGESVYRMSIHPSFCYLTPTDLTHLEVLRK